MFDLHHFRLSFLLAALTAGFAFSGCETDDEDDGGLTDAGAVDKDDSTVDKDDSTVKEDECTATDLSKCTTENACQQATCNGGKCGVTQIEGCCLADDDCSSKAGKCQTATCDTSKNECKFDEIPNCCTENADCVSQDSCKEGACKKGEDGVSYCEFSDIAGCCNDVKGDDEALLHSCANSEIGAVCDLANKVCVECLADTDCPSDGLNDCQTPHCNTDSNKCEPNWEAGCCFVPATAADSKDVENFGCEAGYGCYKNAEKEVTRKITDTTIENNGRDVTNTFTVAEEVVSGKGVCVEKSKFEACSADCKGETGVICDDGTNPNNKFARKAGARLLVTPDACMLKVDDEGKYVLEAQAGITAAVSACAPAVDYECALAANAGSCKSDICNTRNATMCGTRNIGSCCIPTLADEGCDTDEHCYVEGGTGEMIEISDNTPAGTCVNTSAVNSCTSTYKGQTECIEDNEKLSVTPICKVTSGATKCYLDGAEVPCEAKETKCADEGKVCGEKPAEPVDEAVTKDVAPVVYACIDAPEDPCEGKTAGEICGENLFCQVVDETQGTMDCAKLACSDEKTVSECPTGFECASESEGKFCTKSVIPCIDVGTFCEFKPNQNNLFCVATATSTTKEEVPGGECKVIACESAANCPEAIADCDTAKHECVLKCIEATVGLELVCNTPGEVCTASADATPTYACAPKACDEEACPEGSACNENHLCMPSNLK